MLPLRAAELIFRIVKNSYLHPLGLLLNGPPRACLRGSMQHSSNTFHGAVQGVGVQQT